MKIIIATGASGGHIFPALSLADELRDNFEIVFVCDKGKSRESISQKGYKAVAISAVKPGPARNIFFFLWRLFKSFVESIRIIRDFKPDVVAGFGSYVSFAVVLAAKSKKIPTIIHEQNVIPGKANRILSGIVDKIAVSFAEGRKYFPESKVVLTGCPLRRDLLGIDEKLARERFNFVADKFTILVSGGSQGSHHLNLEFIKAISGIEDKRDLQVIHLTGSFDYDLVKSEYGRMGIAHCVFAFLEEMGYAYKIADLVISRAGASAITEIVFFRKAAILVPYPFAEAHQIQNAKILTDKGGALLIEDSDLSAEILRENILELKNNRELLNQMAMKNNGLAGIDAAKNLADEVKGCLIK
jgi:UDP-N-acetylglucosamine--N-acetylmuramyl-(pentapeptide) pyrophosphoryl-undecaprenol N-acetylglucosamine transferase